MKIIPQSSLARDEKFFFGEETDEFYSWLKKDASQSQKTSQKPKEN